MKHFLMPNYYYLFFPKGKSIKILRSRGQLTGSERQWINDASRSNSFSLSMLHYISTLAYYCRITESSHTMPHSPATSSKS